MVAVVEQLGGALGVSGLLVLPCVAAHLNQVNKIVSTSPCLILRLLQLIRIALLQIIIDSFLVSLWKQKEVTFEKAKIA